jgi:hypothetical protein
MAASKVFEYAVIRLVPVVEREEFINVGVVIFCKELNYLAAKIALNQEKLRAIAPQIDQNMVSQYLNSFQLNQ